MSRIRFLHCADIHLDLAFAGSLATEPVKAMKRREELKECFEDICCLAKYQRVDFLLIAGDLYEQRYIRKSTIDFIIAKLKDLFPIQVFICAGNHDPFLVDSVYEEINKLPNVHVFGFPEKIELPELNFAIYGEGFTDFYKDEPRLTNFDKIDETKINILLSHGSLNIDIGKNRYNPLSKNDLLGMNMDYVGLGHFHGRMIALENEGKIYNPGSPEALGFDEQGEHGVYIVEIEKVDRILSKNVTFVPTGKRKYFDVSVDISGVSSLEALINRIAENVSNNANKEDFVKIVIKGFVKNSIKIDNERIAKSIGNYYFVKIENMTIPEINFEQIEEGTLKGEFIKKMLNLINNSENERERKNLTDALNIGVEVIETGSLDIDKYL